VLKRIEVIAREILDIKDLDEHPNMKQAFFQVYNLDRSSD
jgi:hypothetical protein